MGAEQVAFTEKRVNAFPHPARGYVIYWDEETMGLGLRVTTSGARAYIFEKRVHGQSVRVTIGDPAAWKLDDACKEARRLVTLVDRGIDPRDEAAEVRARADAGRIEASRHELIVEGVWAVYIDARKSKWGERHLANHIALADLGGKRWRRGGKGRLTKSGPLASLMKLKLSQLSADRIAGWLKRESAKRPTSTAQAYRALRAFVAWTHEYADEKGQKPYKGIVPTDAFSARSVRENVPKAKAKSDCLQREQLSAWFSAVRSLPNAVISAYLQTVLITGPRRGEMSNLRWSDVDFKWNGLTLRDKNESKGGENGERVIPLTPYVASLLDALPRVNEWVFSSLDSKSGHIVEPRIAHNKALKAAGLPHITLHGLRRSFSTLSEWVEVPIGVVAQIQGHKPSATAEKHYKVRPLDLLRMWHKKVETWILKEGRVELESEEQSIVADSAIQKAA